MQNWILEMYIFNIFRYQGHDQILNDNEDVSFEMKKDQKDVEDLMNNTHV